MEAVGKTHLIGLSHVAVEDSSHTLDGRMLQFVGPSHVVVNASGQQGKNGRAHEGRIQSSYYITSSRDLLSDFTTGYTATA